MTCVTATIVLKPLEMCVNVYYRIHRTSLQKVQSLGRHGAYNFHDGAQNFLSSSSSYYYYITHQRLHENQFSSFPLSLSYFYPLPSFLPYCFSIVFICKSYRHLSSVSSSLSFMLKQFPYPLPIFSRILYLPFHLPIPPSFLSPKPSNSIKWNNLIFFGVICQ